VQLAATGSGTHLTFTEQGAYYLEGDRDAIVAGREAGTHPGLDQLEAYVTG
jgi:hypothetical protein